MAGSSGSSSTAPSKPAPPPSGGSAAGGHATAPAAVKTVTSPEASLGPPVVLGPDSPPDPVPDLVIKCQKRLIELGWLPKTFVADGNYGKADGAMAKAVKDFQLAAKIVQNGLLGPMGQDALFASNAPKKVASKGKYPDHALPRSMPFPQVAGIFAQKGYPATVQEWGPIKSYLTYSSPTNMGNTQPLLGKLEISPQIGWEPKNWNLVNMVKEFEAHWDEIKDGQPNALDDSVTPMLAATVSWADTLALHPTQAFFFRMMSEMTMPDKINPGKNTWTFNSWTPKQFADAWNWISRVFDARGATNIFFCFNIAQDSGSDVLNMAAQAGEALALIEPGRIDACGMHPYTRRANAAKFVPHCSAWIDRVFKVHRPSVHNYDIGEFGVEKAWPDAERAAELAKIFTWSQQHFRMITYFNEADWHVDKGTHPKTWAVLQRFLADFPNFSG
jgi:hypothetical protein